MATALITPYVQPSGCISAFELTTITTSFESTLTTITVLASDAAAPDFSVCQPSLWDSGSTTDLFTFSPAVCPQDWTYYEMSSTKQYSAAYCCASGFEFRAPGYALPTPVLSPACARTITSGDTTITAPLASHTNTMGTFTEGMIVHRAWHVSWAESDLASMSPSLPPLTSGKYLATWEPGQIITDGAYDHHNGDNSGVRGWRSVLYFAAIGVPLIFLAFITCGGWLLCRKRIKRRAQQVPVNMELRAK
ncbi:hypothetical protein N7448_009905 [Penicillium atrosanguineum]|uniref:uncharacterized protein n=1 Tax=Penicillium atrosanguineum TaxID=1132637 RepID=UPI002391694C|nr:uncharacterized protein N7443_007123 [Penicillium atrosanguineum]KAJ5118193.1 hypothetical protein N7526_009830 [Penicillium atrosanguineum]KAJ5119236.1 hypothetical protein N7448_009905 [Penicillium atrosanguineum]KAJ5296230.1 hypothetical protein N7443_007123 [Penicillium atrosanguineum]